MKQNRLLCLLLTLLFASRAVSGSDAVLVLIHGYLGSAQSWAEAGTLTRLQARGYRHAGKLGFSVAGVTMHLSRDGSPGNPMYTLDLPSLAPVIIQADWLAAQLRVLRTRHPDSAIAVAAHSAGGVVARAMLVRHGALGVRQLITIATPHLGTGRALQALDATSNQGLFSPMKRWLVRQKTGDALYASLHQSRGVLMDLAPPAPGSLLFWLNSQPHPDIRYTSVVRIGTQRMPGDRVVPPVSQDLNRVPALTGRAQTYSTARPHGLAPQDGDLIADLLESNTATAP